MLEYIRTALFRRSLRHLLASQKRTRKTHNLNSAHSIGLLFDATVEKNRLEVEELARSLEKPNKKIRLLGFFNTKQLPPAHHFDGFTLKQTTWIRKPKDEKALAFANESFDLLLCLNPEELPALEWIAAHSPAAMKIGHPTAHANDFDLQLEIPAGKGPRYFMEQLSLYLDKIVLSKHEPAKTS